MNNLNSSREKEFLNGDNNNMRDIIRINRFSKVPDGVFGVMTYNGDPFCLTLEPNKIKNGNQLHIPEGSYICSRHSGPKFKNTWEITDVPGRTAILFHSGNIEDDSLGCILLGSTFGSLRTKLAIMKSSNTFNRFMHISERADSLHLTITNCF